MLSAKYNYSVVKLLEYLQLEIRTPTEAPLGLHVEVSVTMNSSKTTLDQVVAFARLVDVDEGDEVIDDNLSSQSVDNAHLIAGKDDLACYFLFEIPMLHLGSFRVRLVFSQHIRTNSAFELRVLGHVDSDIIFVQDNGNPITTAN